MLRYRPRSFLWLGLLASLAGAAVSVDKLTGEAYSDLGQLVKGNTSGLAVEDQYLSRLGATLTVTDTVQKRLEIRIGVGGIFWQSFPEGDFWQNSIKFGPGINEASTSILFTRNFRLQGGYFPFKYNSPAMNLGEYLLRSESYPTYIATGGWTWVDSAFTRTMGLRLQAEHFGGKFRHEIGLYLEIQNAPLYDLTPAYLFAWQPMKGVEIGGGAALKRWFNPDSRSEKTDPAAQYVEIANFPEVQNQATVEYTYTDGNNNTVNGSGFAAWRPGKPVTSASLFSGKSNVQVKSVSVIQRGTPAGTRRGLKHFMMNTKYSDGTNCWDGSSVTCKSYFDAEGNLAATDANGNVIAGSSVAPVIVDERDITRHAINLMARVNLNLAELLDLKGTGSFKLYAEADLLGVKNQPVYYPSMMERMPVMVGVHIPTFGLLDLLAVESEYLNNPYQDSKQELETYFKEPLEGPNMAIPDLNKEEYDRPQFIRPSVHGDDWKWSVHAVRTILPGLKMKVQVANDHLRLQNFDVQGVTLSPSPQTAEKSEWYYVVHLQWGF